LVNYVTPILLLLMIVDAFIIEAAAGARAFHIRAIMSTTFVIVVRVS
jgi:hypothetical protein